jgi:hypothetical protein
MKLLITKDKDDDNDWGVWVGIDDEDPLRSRYGFCIAGGSSRQEAVTDAVKALERALEQLQAPPGVVSERAI